MTTKETLVKLAPYLLSVAIFLAGLIMYWTKPENPAQVIYVSDSDTIRSYQHKVDSLSTKIVRSEAEIVRLTDEVVRSKKEAEKIIAGLKEMTPTQHVESFGLSTGDTTIVMRAQDSVTLVPLPCIVRANTLFAEGEAARQEAEILARVVQAQAAMVQSFKSLREEDKKYIAYMVEEKNALIAEKNKLQKDVVKQKNKARKLGYTSFGLGAALVVVLLL